MKTFIGYIEIHALGCQVKFFLYESDAIMKNFSQRNQEFLEYYFKTNIQCLTRLFLFVRGLYIIIRPSDETVSLVMANLIHWVNLIPIIDSFILH